MNFHKVPVVEQNYRHEAVYLGPPAKLFFSLSLSGGTYRVYKGLSSIEASMQRDCATSRSIEWIEQLCEGLLIKYLAVG